MSLETSRDWVLKSMRVEGVLWRRWIVSSLDRFDFSSSMIGVIKDLCCRDGQVIVLSGASLSSREEITELKSWRYDCSDVGGVENRGDDRISCEKFWIFIERKFRTDLVMRWFLCWWGAWMEKIIAWWSESDGSHESTVEIRLESERVIRRSRVCDQKYEWGRWSSGQVKKHQGG